MRRKVWPIVNCITIRSVQSPILHAELYLPKDDIMSTVKFMNPRTLV